MVNPLDEYDGAIAGAFPRAHDLQPIITGLTASIDQLYLMDQAKVDALAAAQNGAGEGGRLARAILARIRTGHGGEIVHLWEAGARWIRELLGAPDVEQVGGNAAQASWSLAVLGVPTLVALLDRSAAQLDVLDHRILLADARGPCPVASTDAAGTPLKQPHAILEFSADTLLDGVPLPRSTRVMLRFSHERLETDPLFMEYCRTGMASAALLSGLATQPTLLTTDVAWAVEAAHALRAREVFVHHELSEFGRPADLRKAIEILPVASVGMSLSELTIAAGASGSPASLAAAFGRATGADQVVIHADEWALLVTTDPAPVKRDSLLLANALASARARTGLPSDDPRPSREASFTDDLPPTGPVEDGWYAVVAPAPYYPRPRATVGLGDTFVAGLLLGEALSRSPIPLRKATP